MAGRCVHERSYKSLGSLHRRLGNVTSVAFCLSKQVTCSAHIQGVGEIDSTPSIPAILAIYHKDSFSCRSRSAVHVESPWLVAPALPLPLSCCPLLSSVASGSCFTSLGLISSLILKATYTHPTCLRGCHEAQIRQWRRKGLLCYHLSLKQKEAGCSHWARASLPLSQIRCNSSEAKARQGPGDGPSILLSAFPGKTQVVSPKTLRTFLTQVQTLGIGQEPLL